MPIVNTRVDARRQGQDGEHVPVSSGLGLLQIGPRLRVTLSPLEAQLKASADKGETLPAPVVGWALIDTGAHSTCVDRKTALQAGLAVVDSAPMTSATHAHEIVPIFAGQLDITGIPQNVEIKRAYGANLVAQGLVALIGRDLLAKCILVYNGPDGSFSLSL